MTTVSRTSAAAGQRRASPAAPISFKSFSVTQVRAMLDGGTILLRGSLNPNLEAQVRFDGKVGSPSRGSFLVFTRLSSGKQGMAERPMGKGELKSLKANLESLLARGMLQNAGMIERVLSRIDEALAPKRPAR